MLFKMEVKVKLHILMHQLVESVLPLRFGNPCQTCLAKFITVRVNVVVGYVIAKVLQEHTCCLASPTHLSRVLSVWVSTLAYMVGLELDMTTRGRT